MVARLVRIEKVRGSIPLSSTRKPGLGRAFWFPDLFPDDLRPRRWTPPFPASDIDWNRTDYKESIIELRNEIKGFIEAIIQEAAIDAAVTVIATCLTGVGGLIAGAKGRRIRPPLGRQNQSSRHRVASPQSPTAQRTRRGRQGRTSQRQESGQGSV